MADVEFNSLNPYGNMVAIEGDTPDDAIINLRKIRTPVSIVGFLSHEGKVYIFVKGDIRKEIKNGR